MKKGRAYLAILFGCFFFCPVSMAYASISGKELLTEKAVEVQAGKRGTVAVFMSAKCPCSNNHVSILKKLAADFKNFSFVVIHSNVDESMDIAKPYFEKVKFPFPVIQDEAGKLANEFRALKTPHAFLLNPDGKVLYKGGVTSSTRGDGADKQFLRDALADVEAGRAVKVPEGRNLGCMISRGEQHGW